MHVFEVLAARLLHHLHEWMQDSIGVVLHIPVNGLFVCVAQLTFHMQILIEVIGIGSRRLLGNVVVLEVVVQMVVPMM